MNSKNVKRILSIILIGVLLLGVAACGKTIGTGKEQETKITQESKKNSEEKTSTKKDVASSGSETKSASDSSSDQQVAGGDSSSGNSGGSSSSSSSSGSSSGSSSQPATEAPTEPPAPTWTISVTVDGGAYGGVFAAGTYTYYYQPNAFDALVSTGLPYSGSSYYVSSINGLAEFDHGRFSGWLYSVNGVEPGVGCGSYYLNDGDSVYWHYQGDE